MKKMITIVLWAVACGIPALAQDIITLKNGTDINGKVLEVGTFELRYKKATNPNGPVYVLPVSDILIVRYENGEKDIFSDVSTSSQAQSTASIQPVEQAPYVPYTDQPIRPGMKYKEYKKFYKTSMYVPAVGDPYNRGAAAALSVLLPGLGQAYDGEWGRAAAFFGGQVLLIGVAPLLVDAAYSGNEMRASIGYESLLLLIGAEIGLYVWNIFDAVHVAKVKNMYYQDLNNQEMAEVGVRLDPYLALSPSAAIPGSERVPVAGLSLKFSF